MSEPLIEVKNLSVHFPLGGGWLRPSKRVIRAVDDVSFSILPGEILGLAGESGCGKSTLGKSIMRLVPQAKGQILFEKANLLGLSRAELLPFRKKIQMIFQDPASSLNPRMRIREILEEPFVIHRIPHRGQRIQQLLEMVGLPEESLQKYPHEFSGGQKQRIGIARALAVEPSLLIADEPVSALDVSIQAQILNYIRSIQSTQRLTWLFVSHDLNVIRYLCDRVAIMYEGKIVEILSRAELADSQRKFHPYTQTLLSAVPRRTPRLAQQAS